MYVCKCIWLLCLQLRDVYRHVIANVGYSFILNYFLNCLKSILPLLFVQASQMEHGIKILLSCSNQEVFLLIIHGQCA